MMSITTLTLVSIASSVVAILCVIVWRAITRVDSSGITVSREWLTHHQSNDPS
jgi:hypothetical protein